MNKNKRKHPNFFDIIFVVLIVAVALAAYALSHRESAAVAETTLRSYVVELAGLEPEMADCVAVGDSVTDNIKNYSIGTVTNVEVRPQTTYAPDEEAGIIRETEVPGKINLYVTVEAQTIDGEKQITTDSGYVLQSGKTISCSLGSLTSGGYIVELQR